MRLASWTSLVAILMAGAPARGEPSQRTLAGVVWGWNGPGWWSFQITTTGELDVSAQEHIFVKLAPGEMGRLRQLLSALPKGDRTYGCDRPLPVDVAAEFLLEVSGERQVQRLKYCPDGVSGEAPPELAALIEVWRFVRGQFKAANALGPDEAKPDAKHSSGLEWQLPNKGMKLTRVGAGAQRTRWGAALSWSAAQLMPGVRRTMAMPPAERGQ